MREARGLYRMAISSSSRQGLEDRGRITPLRWRQGSARPGDMAQLSVKISPQTGAIRSCAPRPTLMACSSASLATCIHDHVVNFEAALTRVLLCAGDSGLCPGWWREVEYGWKHNASMAMAARLERHAQQHGDFLPASGPSTMRALTLTVQRAKRPWTILDYWQPELSCGKAQQRTKTNRSSDGGK